MQHSRLGIATTDSWLTPLASHPPAWALRLVGGASPRLLSSGHPLVDRVRLASTSTFTHVATSVPDAERMPAVDLEAAVAAAYGAMAQALSDEGRRAVRFWNFIPAIHADMGDGRDRYMVFNAGRFSAFASWFGSPQAFSRALPTASAVGVKAGPLVVHGLATTLAGAPLENPRQVPAYSYSKRYGPRPPCFARATVLADTPGVKGRWLLVGGTASILGEDSIHVRDVQRQAAETFANLAKLVAAARGQVSSADAAPDDSDTWLDQFSHLRVYVVRNSDADTLRELVLERFTSCVDIEFAQADLCRQELLVEIEGLARLD